MAGLDMFGPTGEVRWFRLSSASAPLTCDTTEKAGDGERDGPGMFSTLGSGPSLDSHLSSIVGTSCSSTLEPKNLLFLTVDDRGGSTMLLRLRSDSLDTPGPSLPTGTGRGLVTLDPGLSAPSS